MSIAAHLEALRAAKRDHGMDWYVSTSWCSDSDLAVMIVRKRGKKIGKPIVGKLEDVLERAVKEIAA